MTFEKLSDDRVLITLRDDDLDALGLPLQTEKALTPEYEQKLKKVLLLACLDAGISAKGRRFLLEALPCKAGYLLLLWAQRVHTRKKYRIKRQTDCPVCFFESTDDMLDAIHALSALSCVPCCSLYNYKGRYCLLFSYPAVREDVSRILSEYGAIEKLPPISLSMIREHGALVSCRPLSRFFG